MLGLVCTDPAYKTDLKILLGKIGVRLITCQLFIVAFLVLITKPPFTLVFCEKLAKNYQIRLKLVAKN